MIPDSQFSIRLLNLNHLDEDFAGWLFLPGMLFKDRAAWWENTPRQSPHEGIDLLFFTDRSGKRRQLPEQALVAPFWDGEVVAVSGDFLGSTVVVRHQIMDEQGWTLVSLYAHVRPMAECGRQVSAEEPLAGMAAGKTRRASAPPDHLHLSLGWLAPGWPTTELDWPTMWTSPGIRLIDPVPVILFLNQTETKAP